MKEGMHILMGKYLSGQTSPAESAALMEWIEAGEQNKEEFQAVKELWEAAGDATIPIFSTEKAWNELHEKLDPAKQKAKVFSIVRLVTGVAAAFIIILSIWLLKRGNGMETYTASARVEKLRLQDGTVVYLRQGARITYPSAFKGNERTVSLNGEAFFDVAHDTRHPFIIHAGEANVQVVGTSFSVIENNNQVELIVKTGKVRFYDKNEASKQLLVSAGEKALLKQGNLTKQLNTNANFNAWQSHQLLFHNTSLPQVVKTIADYYGVRINMNAADSIKLSANEITASFKDQPIETVIRELALIGDIRIEEKPGGAYEIFLK
jgi:transmembrane sensor